MKFKTKILWSVSRKICSRELNTSANAGVYFTVVVDGVVQHADKRIPKNTDGAVWTSNSTNYPFHITRTGESTFTIATGLAAGTHTFAIYNQTEACHGTFGVKSVTLDGTITAAPAESDLYIEFVGDSITAGLGNISSGSVNQEKPLWQDATRGWAYKTAQALGADWSIIARSGMFACDGRGAFSMPTVYPKLRYYSDNSTPYDFARQPDVVVLGLGTNDIWGTSATNTEQGLRQMQTMVRQHNPNAKIVWIYGMMQSSTDTIIKNLVSSSGGAAAGYYALALPYDGAGGQGHPGLAAQTVYANKVTEYLAEILDLGADESPDGWVEEGGRWAYYVDGEKLTSQWQKDSVGWVYLDADGYMLTNAWVKDSVGWCYVGANGYCVTNTWQKDSHGWCYLDASGRMATNRWIKDSVGWCYVGADGYCVTNAWKKDSHGWCYLDGNGRMATNQWVKDSKGWCYVGADGYCVTNAWKKDSHGWCYLDANGRMVVSDWVKDGGKWYYLDASGYMVANKTLKIGGKTYRFNASGVWVA